MPIETTAHQGAPRAAAGPAPANKKAVRDAVDRIVTNIRRDEQEGVLFPMLYDANGNKLFDLTLLSTGGQRQFDTTQVVNRYDQRIAMTVLADFILLGHEKVGSFALASSKTNLFGVALGAWLEAIAQVLQNQAVPRLFAANGDFPESYPQLRHGDVETPDLGELSEYISKLAAAGVVLPDADLENELRRYANLPARVDSEL